MGCSSSVDASQTYKQRQIVQPIPSNFTDYEIQSYTQTTKEMSSAQKPSINKDCIPTAGSLIDNNKFEPGTPATSRQPDSIEQLQAANKQLKDKIKENDQMISFFVKEVADLKQSDAEKTKDISVLRKFQEDTLKGIKVQDPRIAELEAKLRSVQVENADLRAQNYERKSDLSNLHNKLSSLSDQHTADIDKIALSNQEETRQAMEESLKKIHEKYEAESASLKDSLKHNESLLNEKDKRNFELEKQIRDSQIEIKQLQGELQEAKKHKKDSESESSAHQKAKQEAEQKYEELKQRINEKDQRINEKDQKITSLEETVALLKEKVKQAEENLHNDKKQIAEGQQAANKEYEQKISQQEEELASLKTRISELDGQNDRQEAQIGKFLITNKNLTEQVRTRTHEKEEMSKFLHEAETFNTTLSSKLHKNEQQLTALQASLKEAQEASLTLEDRMKNTNETYESRIKVFEAAKIKLESNADIIKRESENYSKLYQQELQAREVAEKELKQKTEQLALLKGDCQNSKVEAQRLDKLLSTPKLPVSVIQSQRANTISTAKLSEHVTKLTKKSFTDIPTLAKELIWAASSDIEKAWLAFLWISQNIAYVTTDEVDETKFRFDCARLLKQKKGYCLDYCYFYLELAKEMGLDARLVTGYAKSSGFEPGVDRYTEPNHHWNSVLLNGNWYLLDVMWGSGTVNAQNEFEFKLRDFYFLTPPEQFLNNHFPVKKQWQLCSNSISLREYEIRTLFYEPYYNNALDLEDPLDSVVQLTKSNRLAISLSTGESVSLATEVEHKKERIPNASFITRVEENSYSIDTEFPTKGTYTVVVYSKKKGEDRNFQCCFKIKVECLVDSSTQKHGLPSSHAAYLENLCVLIEPKTSYLKVGTKTKFKLNVPGADSVAVIIDKKWNHLTQVSGSSIFEATIDINGKEVSVFGRFKGSTNYDSMLVYQGY